MGDVFAMIMPMMQVGIVRVLVKHRRMIAPVGVRLSGRVIRTVDVLVMVVVDVAVFVVQRLRVGLLEEINWAL